MVDLIISIGAGALGGVIYAVVGYFKNKEQGHEFDGFDPVDFLSTVLGSAAVGGIANYYGVTPEAISSGALGVVVTQLAKKLVSAIAGYFKKK
jgi:hypothetical protein